MDLTILAVTALGLVGVYLLLPREKPSFVKLGSLLGILGLGGLFLYLIRIMPDNVTPLPLPFYLFAAIMIVGSVGVICHPRPVYAALYFVLVTLAGAGIFVLLFAEFMAIVLIIVYAGAILVTYVFVIMLASQGLQGNQHTGAEYDRIASEPFIAVFVSFVFLGTLLQVMYPAPGQTYLHKGQPDALMLASLAQTPATAPSSLPAATQTAAHPGNMQLLGATLYGQYLYSLEIAGLILTIALVGAVVISRKNEGPSILGSGRVPAE